MFIIVDMNLEDEVYSIKKKELLSERCFDILKDLYLPIIGYKAYFLYMYLSLEEELKKDDNGDFVLSEKRIQDLLDISNMSSQDFFFARRTLESAQLLNTYKNENKYLFVIYRIYSPQEFFDDLIFEKLFCMRVSEEYKNKILDKYSIMLESKNLDRYNESLKEYKNNISASFTDSFVVKYDKDDVKKIKNKSKETSLKIENKNDSKIQFNINKFFRKIEKDNYNVLRDQFDEKEVEKIAKYGMLYGLSEEIMSELVTRYFNINNEFGSKVNFDALENGIRIYISQNSSIYHKRDFKKINLESETELAERIRKYQDISPRIFLKELQGGIEPVSADLKIISSLSNRGIPNAIINLLIDYCDNATDHKLNSSYIEKVAMTLIRAKKCNNVMDGINYLYKDRINVNNPVKLGEVEATSVKKQDENLNNMNEDNAWEDLLWKK